MSPAAKACKTRDELFRKLAEGQIKPEEASARLNEIDGQNGGGRQLYMKVSRKGCVSVYGLNAQFPMSAYADQWEKLSVQIFGIEDFTSTPIGKFIAKYEKEDFHGEDKQGTFKVRVSRKREKAAA
jgi:hypothetical protein